MLGDLQLRDYQQEAVEAIRRDWRNARRATLLVLATGGGKTIVFLKALIDELEADRHRRVLILVHRKELVEQPVQRIGQFWPEWVHDTGVIFDGRAETHKRITVATVQSLTPARLAALEAHGFVTHVVIDEAHHATAKQYRAVIDPLRGTNPYLCLLGVTATPIRADDVPMREVFTSVAYRAGIKELIQRGYLCPFKAITVETGISLASIAPAGDDDLDQDAVAKIVEVDNCLELIAESYKKFAAGRRAIAFLPSVSGAHALAETLRGVQVRASACDGTTPKDERERTLAAFRRGEIDVLCNCLDAETEILTRRGWVGIDGIRDDDVTATMNLATGGLEWQSISRIVRRRRAPAERMVQIKNQTLDIRVTEGHRMVVRSSGAQGWKVVEAGTLPDRIGPYEIPVSIPGDVPIWAHLSLDECRFIGLFLSDGHMAAGGRGIEIAQSCEHAETNAQIRLILTGCGFDWKVYRRPTRSPLSTGNDHYVYRVPVGSAGGKLARRGFNHLKPFLRKEIADEMLAFTREQTLAVLEGMWLGDGIKNDWRPRKTDTASWHIVGGRPDAFDRLQALCVTRGIAANLFGPIDNGPMATQPLYRLNARDRSTVRTNNLHVPTSGGNPAAFEPDWRDEEVWCVTNRNGTIVTRRNGKVAVMGQCDLFTEGLDIPEVDCVLWARWTTSSARYVQGVGRGFRLAKGKADLLIIDFAPIESRSIVLAGDLLGKPRKQAENERKAAERGLVIEGFSFGPRDEGTGIDGDPDALLARKLDLLGRTRWTWYMQDGWSVLELGDTDLLDPHGVPVVDADDEPVAVSRELAIVPVNSHHRLIVGEKVGRQARAYRVLVEGDIQAVADAGNDYADEHANPALALKSKEWRRQPASENQLRLLTKFVPAQDRDLSNLTRGQAAQLITYWLARKAIERKALHLCAADLEGEW